MREGAGDECLLLPLDQILPRLPRRHQRFRRAIDHDFGRAPAGIVVRRHGHAVGARAHHREKVALLREGDFAVAREEVARLADGPDHIDPDRRSFPLLHMQDGVIGAVEGWPREVVHAGVHHHEGLVAVPLDVENAGEEHPGVADHGASGFGDEGAAGGSDGRCDGRCPFGRFGRVLLVVAYAESAADVDIAEVYAERADVRDEGGELFGGFAEGADLGELAPDVGVDAHDVDVGHLRRLGIDAEGIPVGDAELVFLEAGRYVGMRLRVHIRIDAEGDRGLDTHQPGDGIDDTEFRFRFHVEHEDAGAEGVFDLLLGLPHARVDDAVGGESGPERAEKLAARDDVRAEPARCEMAEDADPGVGLHGVAGEMRHALERAVDGVNVTVERGVGVHIERRPVARGQTVERRVLRVEPPVLVSEKVHGASKKSYKVTE